VKEKMNHNDHFYEYQICLDGLLDDRWFDGLSIIQTRSGETIIRGKFDQSALHGLFNRIRDLGLELISVQRNPQNERDQS